MNQPKYSIVVPCYASGKWLEDLVDRTVSAMSLYGPFEMILVNDKSPDTITWPKIEDLTRKHEFIIGIDLLYNVGQFRATLCGLEQASGQFIITMDDDLQHPPEELPTLIQAMEYHSGMDCVMGKYITKKHNPIRNAGSWFIRGIMNRLYNKPKGIVTTSFRIMPASFAKTLCLYRIASPQLGPLIITVSKKVANVPVQHNLRERGNSGYSLSRCIRETFQSVVNASILPLRWFSIMGFITAFMAFSTGLYFLVRWLIGGTGVAGFTSLILAITFFSGMLLAGIGVLGEYIGRIIHELTGMPKYKILTIVNKNNE